MAPGLYKILPVVFLTSIILVIIKRRYFTSIRDVPGPFVASFTTLWQVYQLFQGHTEIEMIRLHRKYGDFVRISEKEVSVGHPDAVKQILQANIPKSRWYSIFSFPDYRYVNQMSELDPKHHIHKNKNLSAGYSLSNIMKAEPYVDATVELLEKRFDELIKAGEEVKFDHWFNYFAFDVMGEVTFSRPFNFVSEGRDVGNAIANTRALALYIAVMGHYVWFHEWTLGNPLLSRLGLQPTSHIFDTTLAAIDARKAKPDVRKDMLEQWLTVRRQYPDRMEEAEILAAASANVGAGADTVSATLQAFFYYLLRHPTYLQKLRDEIDTAHKTGRLSRVVSYAEAQDLPYLQVCIKETYRYHTAVGTGLQRVVPPGGMTVAGRYFEEGILLSVNPWVFHRNPELFGPDCNSFNPERWLDKERYREMDRFLIHWGAGYNQCPGKHLAHFEISKLAATLVRDYDVEQINPNQPWRFETHFTVVPYDWACRMKRRDLYDLIAEKA